MGEQPAPAEGVIQGKWIVLVTLGVAIGLTGVAVLHHYRNSHRAAQFWGRRDARLLVASEEVTLWQLAECAPGEVLPHDALVAGRRVAQTADLTSAPGLVHFRHAFTQDAHFAWDQLRSEAADGGDWTHALRFADREAAEPLIVLLNADAAVVGRLHRDQGLVDRMPCPEMAGPLRAYLEAEGLAVAAVAE